MTLGRETATMVVTHGRVVNVHTHEVLEADIVVVGDRIVEAGACKDEVVGPATEVVDAAGAYVVPGFIEPHMHAGEPSLAPRDLARALLERGTTTLATDLVEFYALGGPAAVRWALDELHAGGLRTLLLLPLHLLGAEELGTLPRRPSVEDFLEMGKWPETIGVNEPTPDTVLAPESAVLEVVDAVLSRRRVFEGHAAGLAGPRLQAYLAAGASSDHESTTTADALTKLRLGCQIIIRECASSQDLQRLVPVLLRYPEAARFFMVCSDDMQAKELVDEGHIDHKLRVAINAGVDPVTAIQLATVNPAEYLGLAGSLGSITPGRVADLLLVDSLTEVRPKVVIAAGKIVARDGRSVRPRPDGNPPPPSLAATVRFDRPLIADDLRVPAPAGVRTLRARVIGIDNSTLASRARVRELAVADNAVLPDLSGDILKVVALDRHTGSGRVGLGFVHGVGLKYGALATTFTAPHYGLLVIGTDDEEIVAAATAIQRLGGGLVAVRDGQEVASVVFDMGGFAGSLPLDEMHRKLDAFEQAAQKLGSLLTNPLVTLASLTIPQIPMYGLSDLGLYDVEQQRFVDIAL